MPFSAPRPQPPPDQTNVPGSANSYPIGFSRTTTSDPYAAQPLTPRPPQEQLRDLLQTKKVEDQPARLWVSGEH